MMKQMVRAQLSLEFLILLAAFVAFLIVWIPLVLGIKEAGEDALAREYAKLALADMKNAADDVCVFGKNNAREVRADLMGEWKIGVNENEMRISNAHGVIFSEKTKCALERAEFELKNGDEVIVKNNGKFVSIARP